MNSEYTRINHQSRLQSPDFDSNHAALRKKIAQSRTSAYPSFSPSVFLEESQTTPTSNSCDAETPTRVFSRGASSRFSVNEFSETSSTRAATPPPVNSVNVSLNREICSQSTSCAQLINLAVSKGHVFNAVNWATCLHRFAKLFPTEAKNHRSTVARFLSMAHEVLLSASEGAKFQPQHLATLLWAMAKLSIIDPGFVEDLIQRSIDVSDSLKAQDMANIAWSLAKMGIGHQRIFSLICARISDRRGIINHFKPMEIASTTWALGTVGAKGMGVSNISVVIESLVSECLSRELREFSPQALANVMWALAKLQYPHEVLFRTFADHVVETHRLREFKPQEIANVVWSMQSNGLVHARLYSEIVHGKAVNWSIFDSHALATVCGAMMDLVDSEFALVIASRVMASKLKSGFSVSHSGILLCELSGYLGHPSVAAAASMLCEKILSDISIGSAVDIHTIRGLLATLGDSSKLIEQLSRCCLVESEYAVSSQLANVEFVLLKLVVAASGLSAAGQDLSRKIIVLAKAVLTTSKKCSFGALTTVAAAAFKYAMLDADLLNICECRASGLEEDKKPDHLVPLLSVTSDSTVLAQHSITALSLSRQLAKECVEKISNQALPTQFVGDIVLAANRIDFALGTASKDAVIDALLTVAIKDCLSVRTLEYSGEIFTKILYGASEFVSRRTTSHPISESLKTICEMASLSPLSCLSLSALSRLVAAAYSLDLKSCCDSVIAASSAQQTLLAQCMQSGPGGLKLLRENLDSFSLFCKVVSAHLVNGVLPSIWVHATDPLSSAEKENVFSLEGALSLSVALGNVGAVEAQKDVISNWVIPLMGASWSEGCLPAGSSPSRQERLRSYSDLLSLCMPHSGFDLSEV